MNKKVKVISSDLKNRCKSGNLVSIQELLETLFNNKLIALRKTKTDFEWNQGYLSALEEVESILSKE